ncbi:MAG: HNH endonuclease [Candidatus Gastranaerophilales bacterium]|nr:HNH endonuclease [Candidatus Gastranaerophilales bacterium]
MEISSLTNKFIPAKPASKEAEKPLPAAENKIGNTDNKTSSKAAANYFKAAQSINFGGTSGFKIKKLEDVPCPCCGLIMLTPDSTKKHVNRLNMAKGNKLADRIEQEEEPVFRSNERACAMMAAKTARGTDMNLMQAINKANENLPANFNNICTDVLLNASVYCEENFGENSEIFKFLMSKTDNFNQNNDFYRPNLTEELAKFKNTIPEDKYNALEDMIMKMPLDYKSVEKVMKTIVGKSPTIIAQTLYAPSLATAEHVHPHSLGGKNTAANFLSECAGCNNPRSSMSYLEWLKIHPEFSRNPQVYIEHVEGRIVNGELPDSYYSYPVDIKETLTSESEGHINLKVLDKDKLIELRNAKKAGQEVDIHAETEKSEETEKTEEE